MKYVNKYCIIKPICSGLIEDNIFPKVVYTSKLVDLDNHISRISICPSYIQNLIEKAFDIRVTTVGESIFATAIHSQENDSTKIDWRKGEIPPLHTKHNLPSDIEEKCVILLKKLNLKFGAIDLILNKNNKYIFLEINPNGQWAWIEKQLGYNISNEIVKRFLYEDF